MKTLQHVGCIIVTKRHDRVDSPYSVIDKQSDPALQPHPLLTAVDASLVVTSSRGLCRQTTVQATNAEKSTPLDAPFAGGMTPWTRQRCFVVGGGSVRRSADSGSAAVKSTWAPSPRGARILGRADAVVDPSSRVGRASIYRGEAHRTGLRTRWASRCEASFDPPYT
jgi:hypothetical protein